MRSRSFGAAAFALVATCSRPQHDGGRAGQASTSVADSVVLERTLCFGLCPAYRLRLSNSGEIRFESRNPGEEGRTATDTTTAATLSSLVSGAIAGGFFEMPRQIVDDPVLCRNRATDHPTVTISIFRPGDARTVVDYLGCMETVEHDLSPRMQRLRSFENEIDSVLVSSRWVRPARRR